MVGLVKCEGEAMEWEVHYKFVGVGVVGVEVGAEVR